MFSTALFVLGAVGLTSATQVKYIKASATDPLNSQGNWTLHSIAPSAFILEDAPDATVSNVSAYVNGNQVKMDCPYDGLVAALLPVDGSDPKQYTFEFVKADAKLAEGAITDGWYEEDAIPGINYPDLKKIGNSNIDWEGFFDVVDDGDFDFPALSWIEQKPQNGQGYQIVIDYAHDAECIQVRYLRHIAVRTTTLTRNRGLLGVVHASPPYGTSEIASGSCKRALLEPTRIWITYPVDEANPPALLIPDAAEFPTISKVEPIYAVDLKLPDAAEVSKMYMILPRLYRVQHPMASTLGPQLQDLPAQRTDSEQTVDSPFASGLNTPADVGNQTNPFDYAHRKVFGEDGEEPSDQKVPALDTVHGRALGGKQSGSETPRARVPSLNEAALRALAMERVESDASSSSVGGDSPLLETGEARDSIYSMPNTSISPVLKGASPALPAQAEGVAPSISFSVPDDTVQITAGPTASAINIAPPDMATVSSTRAVYAADDDVDPFADPFSDAHEFVDSIMGEDAASGSTTANANLNVPNARADLDQGPVRKNDAADDDPFLPGSGAAGATISANTDTFILSNSSVVDSTSSVGIPDMDSLDFIASLGIRPPAPSMTGLAAVAESESATLNPGATTSMSLGAAAASLHNIANRANANANTSIDDDAPLDSDDSFDSDASMYTTRDNNASLDHSCGVHASTNNIDYELANDLDYALDYDVAPMPASFTVSSIYALDVQTLAVGFLKVLLFLPWCVAVGAVILLAPEYLEVVAFGAPEKEDTTGSIVYDAKSDDAKPDGADDSKTDGSSWSSESVAGSVSRSRATSPADGAQTDSSTAASVASTLAAYLPTHVGLYPYTPRGIRRLAHWAEYALPHVAIFGAAVVGLIYVLGAYVDAMVCAAVVVGAVGVGVVRMGAAGASANEREEGIVDVCPGEGDESDGEVVGGENDGAEGGEGVRAAPRVGMDDAETVRVILKAYVMGKEIPGMRRVGGGDDGFVWV
ncbi:hypothetical protein FB107DRAFT_220904 [Schizophyllum commune]